MLDECFLQDKENRFTDTTSERTQRQFLKKVEMGFLPIYVERQRWETGGILAVNEGGETNFTVTRTQSVQIEYADEGRLTTH